MHSHSHIENEKASTRHMPIYDLFSVLLRYPYYKYSFLWFKEINIVLLQVIGTIAK